MTSMGELTSLLLCKYLLLFRYYWKRVPPVSEDFFARFLTTINTLLGIVRFAMLFHTGERGYYVYLMAG